MFYLCNYQVIGLISPYWYRIDWFFALGSWDQYYPTTINSLFWEKKK